MPYTWDVGGPADKVPKKRGPKPKPKVFRPSKPVTRVERSYSKKKKEEVIMYLIHEKRPDPWNQFGSAGPPSASLRQASEFFKIPRSTICSWWAKYRRDQKTNEPPQPPTASNETQTLQAGAGQAGNNPAPVVPGSTIPAGPTPVGHTTLPPMQPAIQQQQRSLLPPPDVPRPPRPIETPNTS